MNLVDACDYVIRTPSGHTLQEHISFRVKPGDRLGVTGPSGCGKSTLLRQIALGASGKNVDPELKVDVSRADFLPQSDFLFPWFTPRQNYNAWRGENLDEEINETDLGQARRLEIESLLDRRFSQLSGGERQRVALWTALSGSIDLLLIDEPFTALDIERKTTCLESLSTALGRTIKSLIFVSHDFDTLTYLANRILLFDSTSSGGTRMFEFPGPPPANRMEYLSRRAANEYASLLEALTRGKSEDGFGIQG